MSNIKLGLLDLPNEILQKIFIKVPNELKSTCKIFFVMYNDQYMNLFIERFGMNTLKKLLKFDYKYLIDYIKSFDYWRKVTRQIVSNYYNLKDINDIDDEDNDEDKLNVKYIRDSWKLIFSIYMNRRIFLNYEDYQVNEFDNFEKQRSINVNKKIKLTPGLYNLSMGLIIKRTAPLSSTNFKIFNLSTSEKLLDYTPVSHFSDLVDHNKLVLVDLGMFEVNKSRFQDLNDNNNNNEDEYEDEDEDKLIEIRLVVEEINTMVKSGYIICFVDINAYQFKDYEIINNKFNSIIEKYWIAWWIENQIPKTENVVNILLQRLYKSIENSTYNIKCEEYEKPNVSISTYNEKFYSVYNNNNELIKRNFRFKTNKDRNRYNELIENKKSVYEPIATEPLKWKMSTIMEL